MDVAARAPADAPPPGAPAPAPVIAEEWGTLLGVARSVGLSPQYIIFAALRLLVIVGSLLWLAVAPLPPGTRPLVGLILFGFAGYSLALYGVLWVWPPAADRLSLVILAIDLAFTTALVRLSGGLDSPFDLAFYFLAALQALFFGLARGLGVAAVASILYLSVSLPMGPTHHWSDAGLRVAFLVSLAVALGLVAERERHRRRAVRSLNWDLEARSHRLAEVNLELETLQRHMRNILDSIADGIVTVDLEGRVTLWNQSMQRHYEVAPPEVLGRRLVDVFPALVPEGVAARVEEILAGRAEAFQIQRQRHQTLRRGTAVMDLEGIALRDARGERIGAVLVVTDVTQQDVAAHQLQQTEKLAAIGTLAAGVAHEINNPVGVITARVETMLWDADDMGLPPAVQEDLRVIDKHAQRVAKIARGLLSFARRAPWETTWVDLNRLLEEALLLVERQFAKEGILLERALEPGLPPIRGSLNHLEQVMINFLNNAREAMAGGGRLAVSSRRGRREGWVEVRIADSGPGIPAEHLSHIFDPFFTTKAAGTGLGLAVSYGIVQEHGGTIEVESAIGRGTTFVVALPVAGAAARPAARPTGEAAPPAPAEVRSEAGRGATAGGGKRQGEAAGAEGGVDGRA